MGIVLRFLSWRLWGELLRLRQTYVLASGGMSGTVFRLITGK